MVSDPNYDEGEVTLTRLAEIEARLTAATPGPWMVRRHGRVGCACKVSNVVHGNALPLGKHIWAGKSCAFAADAELIAHAPEDLHWLIARVRELLPAAPTAGSGESV